MEKYSLSIRFIHWVSALFVIALLIVGIFMQDMPVSDARNSTYMLHKSFGMVLLFFVILRVSVRVRSSIPLLPGVISALEQKLSALTIFLLYVMMLVMPLSGYLMTNFFGHSVPFFFFSLPAIVQKNPELGGIFRTVHGVGGTILIVLISLHVIGTLKHFLFDKVNLLKRII